MQQKIYLKHIKCVELMNDSKTDDEYNVSKNRSLLIKR